MGCEGSAVAAGRRRAGAELLVGGVAKAVGVAGFELDDPVGALAGGVGDAGVEKGEDLRPPLLYCRC